MSTILIVEDEQHLAEGLRFNLELDGHEVVICGNGQAALDLLLTEQQEFTVIVLDVMLPGADGFTVAEKLREAGNYTPILMLTARGQSEDVLQGFAAGADDYLPKPFELAIFLARLNGLLRRRMWLANEPKVTPETEKFLLNGREIDLSQLLIRTATHSVRLTLMEAKLLRHLYLRAGQVVSRKEILEDVWQVHEDADTRPIDNFIVRLRRYLEDDPTQPRHLLTVRGVGYRLVPQPEAKELTVT